MRQTSLHEEDDRRPVVTSITPNTCAASSTPIVNGSGFALPYTVYLTSTSDIAIPYTSEVGEPVNGGLQITLPDDIPVGAYLVTVNAFVDQNSPNYCTLWIVSSVTSVRAPHAPSGSRITLEGTNFKASSVVNYMSSNEPHTLIRSSIVLPIPTPSSTKIATIVPQLTDTTYLLTVDTQQIINDRDGTPVNHCPFTVTRKESDKLEDAKEN